MELHIGKIEDNQVKKKIIQLGNHHKEAEDDIHMKELDLSIHDKNNILITYMHISKNRILDIKESSTLWHLGYDHLPRKGLHFCFDSMSLFLQIFSYLSG